METGALTTDVGELLLAFKGAVNGYVPIKAIIENDNSSQHLALRYFVEKQKLILWGLHFNVDEEKCAFQIESHHTQQVIAAILAEIQVTHAIALPYVSRYSTGITQPVEQTAQDGPGYLRSWAKKAKAKSGIRKTRHGTRWTVKDKAKFEQLVNRLTKLNTDLYNIIQVQDAQLLDKALISAVIASLDEAESLDTLQDIKSQQAEKASLLGLSAKVKKLLLSSDSDAAKWTIHVPASSITLAPATANNTSTQAGYYDSPGGTIIPIWVEWKVLQPQLSAMDKDRMRQRILALGAALSTAAKQHSEFLIPSCVGTYEDREYAPNFLGQYRIGYIFQVPAEVGSGAQRYSLHDIITRSAQVHDRYPLGARFQLAKSLAISLSLLHACSWLHKGFRSQNIIFASSTPDVSISRPMVTGFEYSHPHNGDSASTQWLPEPEVAIYQHPEIGREFQKMHDVYSLGVVLFEIALWRPLIDLKSKKIKKSATRQAVRDFLLNNLVSLRGLVGDIYTDVVKTCLTCSFVQHTTSSGHVSFEQAFFSEVIQKLDSCKA